mgnify:CR=1 FL=1
MVTGNIKTQAYQNPVTAAGNTQKISTKTDFSQSIRQAAGSYAGTDNKSQNVSRNQEAAKDSSTAKNAVKSEMTDRDAKSSDVRSTKTETAAVDKNSEKEETNPEIAAVDKNSEKEEINLEIAAVLAGTQLQNTAVDVDETVVSDFLQDIAQQLEVSVDDLMQSMQKLNLQVTDLQDPQNVLKLMTDVKDLSGTAEILTSPGLMETFKEINSQAKDFAQFHPGGTLGKRLLTTAHDVMRSNDLPVIPPGMKLGEAIIHVSKGKLGLCVAMVNDKVVGLITDGDVRRAMESLQDKFFNVPVEQVMTRTPKCVSPDTKIAKIQDIMHNNKIHTVLVVDDDRHLLGVVDHFSCMF